MEKATLNREELKKIGKNSFDYVKSLFWDKIAKVAKEKINKVVVGNIERINLTDYFTPNYFDFIIFVDVDVLEHLKDPWTVLS